MHGFMSFWVLKLHQYTTVQVHTILERVWEEGKEEETFEHHQKTITALFMDFYYSESHNI